MHHHGYVLHAWPLSLPPVHSIKSTLESHLDQKELPPLLGLEVLPEEITLGQGADVWRAAVEFKRRWIIPVIHIKNIFKNLYIKL